MYAAAKTQSSKSVQIHFELSSKGLSVRTLQRWDQSGKLKAHRDLNQRRYYTEDQLVKVLGFDPTLSLSSKLKTVRLPSFHGENLIIKLGETELICFELHQHHWTYAKIAGKLNLPTGKQARQLAQRGQLLRYSNTYFMLQGSVLMADVTLNMKVFLRKIKSRHVPLSKLNQATIKAIKGNDWQYFDGEFDPRS